MIGTIDVKCHAASPQIPLRPLCAFAGSPSSVRLIDVPRKIGQWRITSVAVSVSYPDNRTVSRAATLVAGCWVATLDGCDTAGRTSGGFAVTASGTDEAGAEMRGYVLGRGDVVVLDGKETVAVGETTYHLRFFDAPPESPQKGDMCVIGGALKWWDGTAWTLFGAGGDMSHSEFAALPSEDLDPEKVGFPEICDMVNKMKKALRPSAALLAAAFPLFGWGASVQSARLVDLKGASPVVTNVNLAGLATTAEVTSALAPYAKRTEIPDVPTKVSALTNDAGYLTGESDPTVPAWAKAAAKPKYTASEVGAVPTARKVNGKALSADVTLGAADVGAYTKAQTDAAISAATGGLASVSSVASVSSALGDHVADDANPHGVTAEQVGALTRAEADADYYPKGEGDLWAAWWSGDGFRVTVTNYNVSPSAEVPWARLPSARFEYRPDGDATNDLRTVWDEETKWTRWRGEFAAATNDFRAALDGKAGLDWGATTPTGFDAPAGFTWLDTPATVISGGLAWQKTVTGEGAFWVLASNGMVAQFGAPGASTNGYFRIADERGNAVFEIVAGDKVTVGANAASVRTWTHTDGRTRIRVVYDVDSAEAPKLYAVKSLSPGGVTDWKEVGTEGCAALAAGWTGQRGAWTNALWLAEAPASAAGDSLFVCATYERGGDTVVKNHAAVSMEKLVIGGKTYAVGTATVSGHTVLTLSEVNQ